MWAIYNGDGTTHSAVPTPGLELGIDMTGTDQGAKSQSSYTPSAWGLPGTVTTVPSGRQERIQHKIKCSSISERQSQDTPIEAGYGHIASSKNSTQNWEWYKLRTQEAEAGLFKVRLEYKMTSGLHKTLS